MPSLVAPLVALALAACGESALRVHVAFPEGAGIEAGAPVRYHGVAVGEVENVSLRQSSPLEPALVQLTLEVSSSEVTLREADRFHIKAEGGRAFVLVVPSPEPSPPLVSGASVVGVPPLVTRVEESVGSAIDSLAELVSEAAREALAELSESVKQGAPDTPPAPAEPEPGPEPAPPR
jgi:ABC-type transporter Mla subunit MlaD